MIRVFQNNLILFCQSSCTITAALLFLITDPTFVTLLKTLKYNFGKISIGKVFPALFDEYN